MPPALRAGIYGCGNIARNTHIPHLGKIDGVSVVAVTDPSDEARTTALEKAGLDASAGYADAHDMLEKESLDVLFSCVPAMFRTDVEVKAVESGIHLFSEKPQAVTVATAKAISAAIRKGGVLSTVGFRERYRPMFHKIRAFLADKDVIHATCTVARTRFWKNEKNWLYDEDRSGGFALEWGCHAVDYNRFMTGLDIDRAQAFYCRPAHHDESLAASFNFRFTNGATFALTLATLAAEKGIGSGRRNSPVFTILYEGGRLDVFRESPYSWSCEIDGETFIDREEFDPWMEQDRMFIEAIHKGSEAGMHNDYHDGLNTLGPLLAGWESSKNDGAPINVAGFLVS
jgi:predicted dehydrogenase